MKTVKICFFALGRSQREEKSGLGGGHQGGGHAGHHHTWSNSSLLKTGSHREHKLPTLCLGGPAVKEKIPMSSSKGINRERAEDLFKNIYFASLKHFMCFAY